MKRTIQLFKMMELEGG
ncbi:BH1156 [Halalkalibacterium halodurans C-125]|uniref:BH1156 protein n=1 Tax=Halalkalibacterium halodurans (strain ATCC BAA-125 / DSM 18197 / FERM 7344 / JCM 9153 / C-125) TaxID=272558 RepID=Q9KDQ5_HALH5|nr:BH1156 [Halalkalibacterium halodurans C-125]